MNTENQLVINEREAASRLGLSPRSLQRLRLEGGGPEFVKVTDKRVGYSPDALRAWIASRTRASTSQTVG